MEEPEEAVAKEASELPLMEGLDVILQAVGVVVEELNSTTKELRVGEVVEVESQLHLEATLEEVPCLPYLK